MERKAPCIGNNCLIGAGATVVGNIQIGDNVKSARERSSVLIFRITVPWSHRGPASLKERVKNMTKPDSSQGRAWIELDRAAFAP